MLSSTRKDSTRKITEFVPVLFKSVSDQRDLNLSPCAGKISGYYPFRLNKCSSSKSGNQLGKGQGVQLLGTAGCCWVVGQEVSIQRWAKLALLVL